MTDSLGTVLAAPTGINDIGATPKALLLLQMLMLQEMFRYLSALRGPGSMRDLRVSVPVDWVVEMQQARGFGTGWLLHLAWFGAG